MSKPTCIIADLDNTIADTKHRAHYLNQTPKAWDEFNAACINDQPITHVIELLRAMNKRGHSILIVSGRDNVVYEQTIDWLYAHNCGMFTQLFMRATGDYTEDTVLKERWLDELILPRYDPLFALDDRNRVVAMWRRRGIPCLQVQEGDF